MPDDTLVARLPDSDQHDFSLGIGWRTGRFTIDAAYMAAYYVDRKTQNPSLSGEYKSFGHFAGLSAGYVL